MISVFDQIEGILGKRENAADLHYLLFLTIFVKTFT